MPSEALSLALAASIYPPALAAVIALGRGSEVRLRVVLFVIAAYLTTFLTGALILLVFTEAGATRKLVLAPSAGLYVLGGVAMLWFALRFRQPRKPQGPKGPSKVDGYLQSRWRIAALGVILYVVPSPIFVGGTKAIADADAPVGQELVYLAQMLLIMLWLIELPMLMLIAFPRRGVAALERVNDWFARHWRELAVLALAAVGLYLLAVGLVELLA